MTSKSAQDAGYNNGESDQGSSNRLAATAPDGTSRLRGGTGVSQDITVLADLLGHCSVLESMNQDPLVAAGEQSRPEPSRTVPSPQLEMPVSNWLR